MKTNLNLPGDLSEACRDSWVIMREALLGINDSKLSWLKGKHPWLTPNTIDLIAAFAATIDTDIWVTKQNWTVRNIAHHYHWKLNDFKTMCEGLKAGVKVRTLNLRGEIWKNAGHILAEALQLGGQLHELNLIKINITEVSPLVQSIERTTLRALDLSDNYISWEGAMLIAKALKSQSKLEYLNLWDNNIGNKGLKAIADAIHEGSKLEYLDLFNNGIDHEGVLSISQVLTSSELKTINLCYNNVGDYGAWSLALAVGAGCKLISLDLSFTKVGDQGVAILSKALRNGTNLQTLKLNGNDFGATGYISLVEALRSGVKLDTLSLGYPTVEIRKMFDEFRDFVEFLKY